MSAIADGLLALVAAGRGDGPDAVEWTARKLHRLRVFADDRGRMAGSLADTGGSLLLVPQFTLYGDVSRGSRPSFDGAAPPKQGAELLDRLAARLTELGVPVARGRFGAHMRVELVNDGPVTIWLESP